MAGISKIMVDFLAIVFFPDSADPVFVIFMLIYRFVIRPVLRLPVLRQIDSFIGFFVGILQCILFLLVGDGGAALDSVLLGSHAGYLFRDSIDQTFLFRWVYDWNPASLFFPA